MAAKDIAPNVPVLDRIPQEAEDAGTEQTRSGEYDRWLRIAQESYRTSVDYYEQSVRVGIEKAYAHFRSRHAPSSKYYREAFKFRSKFFSPKTRSAIDDGSASVAQAFFSTQDAISVTPENPGNPQQQISADIHHALVNYRLETSIKWFPLCVGAFQDAQITGTVISKQYWRYREQEVIDMSSPTLTRKEKIEDRPDIKLYPIENVRFDPSASWLDIVGSSPYIILEEPMNISDFKAMRDSSPHIPWFDIDDEKLETVGVYAQQWDSTRKQREGLNRTDSKQEHAIGVKEYKLLKHQGNI